MKNGFGLAESGGLKWSLSIVIKGWYPMIRDLLKMQMVLVKKNKCQGGWTGDGMRFHQKATHHHRFKQEWPPFKKKHQKSETCCERQPCRLTSKHKNTYYIQRIWKCRYWKIYSSQPARLHGTIHGRKMMVREVLLSQHSPGRFCERQQNEHQHMPIVWMCLRGSETIKLTQKSCDKENKDAGTAARWFLCWSILSRWLNTTTRKGHDRKHFLHYEAFQCWSKVLNIRTTETFDLVILLVQ